MIKNCFLEHVTFNMFNIWSEFFFVFFFNKVYVTTEFEAHLKKKKQAVTGLATIKIEMETCTSCRNVKPFIVSQILSLEVTKFGSNFQITSMATCQQIC